MLSIGLTGGIASGKSLLSARFRELGAIVIDADQLARDVVAPGTDGLAAVVDAFGTGILRADGSLDRPALGTIVFGAPEQLATLNAIVHPRVRAAAQMLEADAGTGTIVVQDIPLLVETGQGANFHLVVVVQAPRNERIARMVANRGMAEDDALARMAAQASDEERAAAADVVIVNDGTPEQALAELDSLWEHRLLPFSKNLAARRPVPVAGPASIVPADPSWPEQASRLMARLEAAVGESAVAVDHIGSTSVPALAAKDVVDLQLRVRSLEEADNLTAALADAGFPARTGGWWDTGHDFGGGRAGERWEKRFHNAADPGRPVNLHIRVDGSPGALLALAFRDWLRSDAGARQSYESFKQSLAHSHQHEASTDGYAQAKEPWFAHAIPELNVWIEQTGWQGSAQEH